MLDEKFCTVLEYAISKALKNLDIEEIGGFWCDGVILKDIEYSSKFINDNRKVSGTVFTGKTGQDEYELIINFGKKSLSRYMSGLEINECVSDDNNLHWLKIDITNKRLILYLE